MVEYKNGWTQDWKLGQKMGEYKNENWAKNDGI